MDMRTAMQELADLIVSRMQDADDELKNKLNFFHSWIFLQGTTKEKEQIIDARNDGFYSGTAGTLTDYNKSSEDYYKETFKTEQVK